MDYYICSLLGLLVLFYAGLLIGDHKLARLRVAMGGVVGKRTISYPSLTLPGGPWMISTTQAPWKGFVLEVQAFVMLEAKDRLWIETIVLSVSEAQYEEVSIESIVYAKYLESRFFKNRTLLDFAVL